MKRLFFALWPDDKTRQQINQLNQRIQLDNIKKHAPANLHVTLVFLGNTEAQIEAVLKKKVAEITTSAFSLEFDTLEYWQHPRVLCLTASSQPDALHELVEILTNMVLNEGVQIEPRPYHAHITLARKVKAGYELDFEPITWQARDFALVESRSTQSGVEYKVLATWPLSSLD